MRIFHFSDTHLGHQQFTRTDEQGLNQREQDLYAAFHRVIDQAVAKRPDLVVHAGDLFDGVRPGNRALAHAMEGFLKLSRAGIPTVAIAGNHEHPKLRETGSPMRLFEHLPGLKVAYQGRCETSTIPTASGKVRVHAVPQCADGDDLASQIDGLRRDGAHKEVLVVHGAVKSIPALSHGEFNELELEASWFDERFDYVALGHYHNVQQVTPSAWYCGAPERASLAEAGQEKGFLDVRLGPPASGLPLAASSGLHASLQSGASVSAVPAEALPAPAAQVTFRSLQTRLTLQLPAIVARDRDAATVLSRARALLADVPAGAVVRLRITELPTSLRGSLDVREIHRAASHALHLDLRLEWEDSAVDVRGAHDLRGLSEEWADYAGRQPMPGLDRDRILAKARATLEGP